MKQHNGQASKFWYAMIQIMLWGGYGLILCYCSNFMKSMDFADGHVSIVLGLGTGLSVVVQLLLAELIQKIRGLSTARTIALQGVAVLIAGILMLQYKNLAMAAAAGIGIGCVAIQTMPSLVNSLATESELGGVQVNYPIARGLGSLAYSVMTFLAGQLIGKTGIIAVPILTIIVGIVLLAAALVFQKVAGIREEEKVIQEKPDKKNSGGAFFANYPYLIVFLFGSVLIYTNHGLVSTFMQQIVAGKGAGAEEQGIAIAISGIMELPAMFGFTWLLKKASCAKWLRVSCVCFVIKAVITLLAPNYVWIYVAQIFQMGGFATYQVGTVEYIGSIIKAEDAVRGQTYLATTLSAGSLIAFCIGGFICQYAGVNTMILTAVVLAIAGGVTVWMATVKIKINQ